MLLPNGDTIKDRASAFFEETLALAENAPELSLSSLNPSRSALVIMDMVNGFAKQGALASPRIGALVSPIASLSSACAAAGVPVLAFADCHTPKSQEFESFPSHCLRGTPESALCAEIAEAADYFLIEKNSTNGFIEPRFQEWLEKNPERRTLIVVGDCTDICVQQFAVAAKTWFNAHDLSSRLIVPVSLVDTYDGPGHNGDLLNLASLQIMHTAGIELCKDILY